jgi:hypothetical protein
VIKVLTLNTIKNNLTVKTWSISLWKKWSELLDGFGRVLPCLHVAFMELVNLASAINKTLIYEQVCGEDIGQCRECKIAVSIPC